MNDIFNRRVPWELNEVSSRAQEQDPEAFTGLGDPTRWGSQSTISVDAYNVPAYSEQLVRVQADDPYPRNWYLVGSLEVSNDMAQSPTTALGWYAGLSIDMGIGQAVITHQLNLRALIDLCFPPALAAANGTWYYPIPMAGRWLFPFVLPGGLVARTLSIRSYMMLVSGEAELPLGQVVTTSIAVSPFAAGHKV